MFDDTRNCKNMIESLRLSFAKKTTIIIFFFNFVMISFFDTDKKYENSCKCSF